MPKSSIHIIGMGATTPVGRNVWASAAAARAGICGFSEHPFMVDTAGEPMCVARAPWIGIDVELADRFCELLVPAIDESLLPLIEQPPMPSARIGLCLSLPPLRPGQPDMLAMQVLKTVKSRYSKFISHAKTFPVGHAGGYLALDAAIKWILQDSIDACIVAGVDSYLCPETLEWLEQCEQLHGAGPLNNAWGFIPGEAAGAILITTRTNAKSLKLDSLGEIVSVGIGRETKLIKTDNVCIGKGLSSAFLAALKVFPAGQQIHNIFCDLNGETYRADEYGFTALRSKEWFLDTSDFVAPADCWGDIGAASALLHIAQSIICHRKRYGKGSLSMTWASSESGQRGAAVINAFDPM